MNPKQGLYRIYVREMITEEKKYEYLLILAHGSVRKDAVSLLYLVRAREYADSVKS